MNRPIERHDRITLDAASLPPLPEAIRDWAQRGLPFVARRSEGRHRPDHAALGLQFPGPERRRVAFEVPIMSVVRHEPPLTLRAALHAFPPGELSDTLRQLDATVLQLGCVLRLYGSYSWQAQTRQPYATSQSDIDLLFAPDSEQQLDSVLRALDHFSVRLKLDGEAIFPGGWGVSWRELHSHQKTILARCRTDTVLMPKQDFLSLLESGA